MNSLFSEERSAEAVLERHAHLDDARSKQLADAAIRHLHAFVKEVELTPDEWARAIAFLTAVGQMCDERRQEFVLLSDTLGVSMLVDAIANRKRGDATESTVLGPFHVKGAPLIEHGGALTACGDDDTPMIITGRVLDTSGAPIAGAVLDVWQTDASGEYDLQKPGDALDCRGRVQTDEAGAFWFRSVRPVSYPIPDDGPVGRMLRALDRHPYRPAHIHFIVSAGGHVPVTTHLFMAGDPYLDSDTVFGVKESLVVEPRSGVAADAFPHFGMTTPYDLLEHEFVLERAAR